MDSMVFWADILELAINGYQKTAFDVARPLNGV